MKSLRDIIDEGFFGNIGTNIIPRLEELFGKSGIKEYHETCIKPIAKIKHANKYKYIFDDLAIGDIIVIDIKFEDDLTKLYIKK